VRSSNVDVRELTESIVGHIEGSYHLPLHRLDDIESVEIPARGPNHRGLVRSRRQSRVPSEPAPPRATNDLVRIADLAARGIDLTVGAGRPGGSCPAGGRR
jgi:hypothetical protein